MNPPKPPKNNPPKPPKDYPPKPPKGYPPNTPKGFALDRCGLTHFEFCLLCIETVGSLCHARGFKPLDFYCYYFWIPPVTVMTQ